MKTWIIPLAVLMVVPALGAATPIVVPPVPEQLVEGHTVFTVIEQVTTNTTSSQEFAAAVAVLVREASVIQSNERFPGVLWFNDQYLVDPVSNANNNPNIRYPCTGAVMAANAGDTIPPAPGTTETYIESYLITDPNDNQWNVDKWSETSALATYPVWTVALLGNDAGANTPDDGVSNCNPFNDCSGLLTQCPASDNGSGSGFPTPGATGYLKYNAVLYFYLEDLTVAGANKFHNPAGPQTYTAGADASGCQVGTNPVFPDQWPCPNNNDDQEGNSHPFNPFNGLPVCVNCVGRGNHGGSAGVIPGTNQGGDGVQGSHATRDIDLVYTAHPTPLTRNYRVIDTEGSTAPYYCEEWFAKCVPGDL
jgi:hypothetical protein